MAENAGLEGLRNALCAAIVVATTVSCGGEEAPELALAIAPTDAALQWGACPALFPAGCEIAILHGDPAGPNADVFFKVEPGYEIPAHWHSSAERMALVSGTLEVTYKGQAASTFTLGSYAYGPAKTPHKASCKSSEPCILLIAFESAVDAHPYVGALD